MRRRARALLTTATAVGAAVVLTACGEMHPGAAVVIEDDYRVSMDRVDDLTAALCEASPLLAEAQGQQAQTTEGIEARQYVVGLLIQQHVAQLAADKVGAEPLAPSDLSVPREQYANITDQMDSEAAEDFIYLLELGNKVSQQQQRIGSALPRGNASNAGQVGNRYVLRYTGQLDIDVDPRLGMSGNLRQEPVRSGSLSIAESLEASAGGDAESSADLVESLPPTQTCG